MINLHSFQCTPYWPAQTGKRLLMVARYSDTKEETATFPFSETFETLLTISSEVKPTPFDEIYCFNIVFLFQRVGIFVHCNVSENSVIVTFEDFSDGMAAVMLINDTDDVTIDYSQKEETNQHRLLPNTFVLYNWESLLTIRELKWACGANKEKKEFMNNLFQVRS